MMPIALFGDGSTAPHVFAAYSLTPLLFDFAIQPWGVGLCRDGNSLPQRPLDLLRQIDQEEVTGGIQVILARLIDDAQQPFLLGRLIRQDLIDLANDQVFTALVFQANSKSSRGDVFHSLSPKSV